MTTPFEDIVLNQVQTGPVEYGWVDLLVFFAILIVVTWGMVVYQNWYKKKYGVDPWIKQS